MKRDIYSLAAAVLLSLVTLAMTSCGGRQTAATGTPQGNVVADASLLRIIPDGNGELVEIVNPWDTTRLLGRYYLYADSATSIPAGATGVRVPLGRSAVFGTVHLGAIGELGALDRVAAVADAQYIGLGEVKSALAEGRMVDLGPSMSPSLEKIVALRPDALLVSPFENTGHGVLDNAGLTIIEMADYMEPTPLGRAEWIRLVGRLYGRAAEADSVFSAVKDTYTALAAESAKLSPKPRVITEQFTDGYWFVPGGKSYMARLLADAGADYPWADDGSAGSLQLDFSAVLAKGGDADYWLIRTYGEDLTLDGLKERYPLNARFKAFSTGGVYNCNTAESPLFEEFPFHPERLLADYAAIFAGRGDSGLRYFHRVK